MVSPHLLQKETTVCKMLFNHFCVSSAQRLRKVWLQKNKTDTFSQKSYRKQECSGALEIFRDKTGTGLNDGRTAAHHCVFAAQLYCFLQHSMTPLMLCCRTNNSKAQLHFTTGFCVWGESVLLICFSSILVCTRSQSESLEDTLPINVYFDMTHSRVWLSCRLVG